MIRLEITGENGRQIRQDIADMLQVWLSLQPPLPPRESDNVIYDESGASSGAGSSAPAVLAVVQSDDRQEHMQKVVDSFRNDEPELAAQILKPETTEQTTKRKRRTKAEMEAARAAPKEGYSSPNRAREALAPQITTQPKARTAPDDPPEVQEQDTADEQAESDARKAENPELTRDDLRHVMGVYAKKYGLPVTLEDGVRIFDEALGEPAEHCTTDSRLGRRVWQLSTVPEDRFAPAVAGWQAAIEQNPFGREVA